jgi:hypothetical protein
MGKTSNDQMEHRLGFHPDFCISSSLSVFHRINPIRLRHRIVIVALEVSRFVGRDYWNMDSLGRSWLHYGVHAITNKCRLGSPFCFS